MGMERSLEKKNPAHAENDAEQNVAPHDRIPQLSRDQTAPGNDGLRPVPANPRLEGQVEHPHGAAWK